MVDQNTSEIHCEILTHHKVTVTYNNMHFKGKRKRIPSFQYIKMSNVWGDVSANYHDLIITDHIHVLNYHTVLISMHKYYMLIKTNSSPITCDFTAQSS